MLSGKSAPLHDLTPSHEHYLRAIWETRARRGYARLTDVARELGVAPPTLSVGLKPLESRALVAHDDNRFLVLTPEGERVARQVHHRFSVMRAFLRDLLGVPADRAEDEACRLEHDVSSETTERMLDLLQLLRDDRDLREHFQRRFAEFHRSCRPAEECSTCDLSCMTPGPARP